LRPARREGEISFPIAAFLLKFPRKALSPSNSGKNSCVFLYQKTRMKALLILNKEISS
jgi:hypothetical protein